MLCIVHNRSTAISVHSPGDVRKSGSYVGDMAEFDLIIRGGTLVDGTGAEPRRADVGVVADRIAAVGDLAASSATAEIDATGSIVTPGFVDPHTHLDAQLCWDPTGSPSNLHGVTTALVGMCGFGIAPCPEGGREYLLRSLEVVEEIPYESTSQGVPDAWRTFGEYLDHLDAQALALNVGAVVPHSALRYAVMGERSQGPADDAERAELVATLKAAIAAGALGMASSRGPNHKDANGDPVPSRCADDAELSELVAACAGRVWQMNVQSKSGATREQLFAELSKYAAWSAADDVRLTWSPCLSDTLPDLPGVLDLMSAFAADGTTVAPQITSQPLTAILSFRVTSMANSLWPLAMDGFDALDDAGRAARLGEADFREKLRDGSHATGFWGPSGPDEWTLARSVTRPDLQGRNVAAIAGEAGVDPFDLVCDLAIADGLETLVQVPIANRDLAGLRDLLTHDSTLMGLGDAGAHTLSATTYTYSTTLLADFVRDSPVLTLPEAVRQLTQHPATFFGVPERGRVEPGLIADLNVIDMDRIGLGPLEITTDLPGGAPRLYRSAVGYVATVVNGVVTLRDDTPTDARPGEVVRSS